jgi:ketosteroid isomerase-like protein
MKKRLIAVMNLFLMLLLCTTVYAQGTDPVDVVMALQEATQAGDIEAQLALFADDAVYTLIPPAPGMSGPLVGKDAIRARREELPALNAQSSIEIRQVDGDTVTALSRYSDDDLRGMSIDFIEGIEEYVIQDGKISTYTWTITDESLANLMAATPSPEALPETGGKAFTYLLVIVLGALAVVAGLGPALLRRR